MAKNILIIDDDASICRFFSTYLRLKGYGTKSFTQAEPGLDELLTGRYDLVLLDVFLQGLSGFEVCRVLREHPATRTLPILLTTAFYKDAELVRSANERYGSCTYLFKPFALQSLEEKVRELIGPPGAAPNQGPLTLQACLTETPFPQLLHNLYTLQATGLLHLQRETVKKVVYLRDGYPIFIRSNLLRECLGQMLVTEGEISSETCEEALQKARQDNRMLGTVLMELGLLTPHQLHEALHRQVRRKLLEIFSWPEGNYRFIQARCFKKGVTAIDLCPATLILEGIRRHHSEAQIQALLQPHRDRFLVRSENPHFRYQGMELSPRDTRLFEQCRGEMTLEQILNLHPLTRRETESMLAALLVSEMVESRNEPVEATESIEESEPFESPESRQLREDFLKDYQRMMTQDYFALLAVERQTSGEEVRKAYFRMVKKHHPDRYFSEFLSPDLRQKVNALFQRIGEAYSVLANPARREQYLAGLDENAREKGPDVEHILQAETAFQKGTVLLRMKSYAEAASTLAWAVKLSPEEPEYLTHYAWALFKAAPEQPGNVTEARSLLVRSADLNPKLYLTHLYLGYLNKEAGLEKAAEKAFELAIQCNPNCTEALRELRLLNLRREKEQKSKGLFGKVFRKKPETT